MTDYKKILKGRTITRVDVLTDSDLDLVLDDGTVFCVELVVREGHPFLEFYDHPDM